MLEYLKWFIRTCTIVGIPCTLFLIAYVSKLAIAHGSCALYEGFCHQYEEISPEDVLETLAATDPETERKVRNR